MCRGAEMKTVTICAVCWQTAGKPCIGRMTGKPLPVKHASLHGPDTLQVSAKEADTLQRELQASVRYLATALPRRSDNNKVSVSPSVKTKQDFERLGQNLRQRVSGVDRYSPNEQKTGELTIGQLRVLAGKSPEVFQRRDK